MNQGQNYLHIIKQSVGQFGDTYRLVTCKLPFIQVEIVVIINTQTLSLFIASYRAVFVLIFKQREDKKKRAA